MLKMDIEGYEWDVLFTALKEGAFHRVRQMALEVHTYYTETHPYVIYNTAIGILRTIEQFGFRLRLFSRPEIARPPEAPNYT